MKPENKRPVSVEDLLRLKRAERPPAEFWNSFDRELRAKQLAALVEKRPWWRTFPDAFARYSRYHLPLGATAVLAVTFLATRDYRVTESGVVAELPMAPQVQAASTVKVGGDSVSVAALAAVEPTSLPKIEVVEAAAVSVAEPQLVSPEPTASAPATAAPLDSPSSRYIAENLRAAQAAEPAVTRGLLGQARGFETRALPGRMASVEPLAQMTTPAAARIAKLNSAMAVSFSTESGARTSERVARRLSSDGDDRLYETVSRIDARGNKVGWKF